MDEPNFLSLGFYWHRGHLCPSPLWGAGFRRPRPVSRARGGVWREAPVATELRLRVSGAPEPRPQTTLISCFGPRGRRPNPGGPRMSSSFPKRKSIPAPILTRPWAATPPPRCSSSWGPHPSSAAPPAPVYTVPPVAEMPQPLPCQPCRCAAVRMGPRPPHPCRCSAGQAGDEGAGPGE